jgi:1-acyl-sn-glycerol-3-phosphate acyltransferase
MQAATKRIQSGVSFAVFAEGTRAQPGQMLPFKKGAFYMARDAGVPIVPVAIRNTDVLMGKGSGEARPGTIEVVILPPVETKGVTSDKEVQTLIEQVQRAIADELGVKELATRK